ncbi:MAG: sialidase family protein [Steroidobacteraceae bacterium]
MVLNIARLSLTGLIATVALVCAAQAQQLGPSARPANKVLAHALDIESGRVAPRPNEPRLSSGAIYAALGASGALAQRANANIGVFAPPLNFSAGPPTQGCSNVFSSGERTNTRVNQDCSLRRQAEEVLAINPTNPDNLIAGQNDSRIGFNKCGYDFSMDGGKTWGDMLPPFYQFVNGDGVTFDACSDPTATFDAAGNAYVGGVLFEIFLADSAFVVAKSNAGIGGAFYHTPAPLSFQEYRDNPLGVVANDNDPNIFNDKEFIVADSQPRSIKQNNVYATWTRFDFATHAGVGGHSPIAFSQSTDGGATWSPGIEISGANAAACTVGSGEANVNACDQDQGSHPIVGPDGTVYVAFGNGNTPTVGVNQHMVVSCAPANDCSKSASWTAPVKITDDFGTQPYGPVASTGCPGGRQCLPPNGYRLDDFVEGSVSVDNSGNLYFVWADFRNGAANCNPNGSAATATTPCDNDVFYSYSTNRGATWSAATNLTPKSKFGPAAQWMPWSGVTADGKTLWVAYYDRSYGNCETTGCNDITLAGVHRPATGSARVSYHRITTASMPNLVVANNPLEAGFLGDYMWLTVDAVGRPNIVWADTRGLYGSVEEDIYFSRFSGDE